MGYCQEETKIKGVLGQRKNTGKDMEVAKYSGNQEQYECRLNHSSPTFLAPGTGFVEDNFSTDWGRGMVQAVMRAMGSGR